MYLKLYLSSTASSFGKDFYIGFMSNFGGTDFTSLRLLIGTTADMANYVVESTAGVIQQGTVMSGNPVRVVLSSDLNLQVTDSTFGNREKGIHVYTTGDEMIFVVVENFVFPFNYGVFLAYPCLTFETNTGYEYFVMSTEVSADLSDFLNSQVLLVGCENDTTISVTPTQSVSLPQNPQILSSTSITVENGTTSGEFTLNQMQTLLITSPHDLTLTKIVSDKPLTVVSGHECASIPSSSPGCEPLAIHVPPSLTWGTSFFTAPFDGRDNVPSFVKLISTEEAVVNVACGTNSFQAVNITSLELSVTTYCFFESSKPLLVVQLATSGSIDEMGRGDPAISLISPTDQYINEISFLSLPEDEFSLNYISVTVSSEHYDSSSIMLNSEAINCEWNEIQDILGEIVGYGCSKAVTSDMNNPTQHKVSHADAGGLISVLVYGFSESPGSGYAFLAGQAVSRSSGKNF